MDVVGSVDNYGHVPKPPNLKAIGARNQSDGAAYNLRGLADRRVQ